MTIRHPIRWLRDHPAYADGLFAAALGTISVIFHLTMRGYDGVADPSVQGAFLAVAATVPIAWRRSHPAAVLLVVTISQMLMEAFSMAGPGWTGVLIAAYSLGAHRSGPTLWRLSGIVCLLITAFIVVGVVHGEAAWQALVSTPIVAGSAIVLGDNMRRRRERAAELVERAERAERERELLAHQHVQDERSRIARELHDVVAHSVSLMVIQTAAARRRLAIDPAEADAVLTTVEDVGRTAMNELRRILGVLRDESGEQVLVPQPGLAALDDLAATARDLPVVLTCDGQLDDVPAGIELSAYRIVQEALTNVRRHAGVVKRVDVSVVRMNGSLSVEVSDDGRGAAAHLVASETGFGLLGMRERVAAYDGALVAGPRSGGGWRVMATFPVGAA
ncbi:MAG: sensor histidine kinase [Actinomycetia bacterium]|nr:sensor histidine kinase [Actinomycetes bacterium]